MLEERYLVMFVAKAGKIKCTHWQAVLKYLWIKKKSCYLDNIFTSSTTTTMVEQIKHPLPIPDLTLAEHDPELYQMV